MDFKNELKQLLSLRSVNPRQYQNHITKNLSTKNVLCNNNWSGGDMMVALKWWKALQKIDPTHPQFQILYQQLKDLAHNPMPSFKSAAVVEMLARINAPTAHQDIKQWLTNAPSEPSLRGALVAAAESDNVDLVRVLLQHKVWSARPISYLIPIALGNRNTSLVKELLNHPVLQSKKDDVLFCMLSNTQCRPENKKIWSDLFEHVLPYLSGDNIVSSLNSYHASLQYHDEVAQQFLEELSTQSQRNKIYQLLGNQVLENPTTLKRKM